MPPISEALSAQIVELLPRLRRFARSLAGNMSDADDLVQITVERALAKSEQLRDGAPLVGWMFGILRNAWIDEARARGRRNRVFAPAELGEQVADPRSERVEIMPVHQAMERLSDEHREVISLVLVEGLSYKEAAQITGVAVGTVTSRLARAREALQAMLGDIEQEQS